jgi:class 3 adenylate cyclase
MNAWIETPAGKQIAIEANCYFGRAQSNTVRLEAMGASRRHAHIHAQQSEDRTEFWLADLGSTNGTLCNGKRITIPHRLKDGDIVNILGESFVFRLEKGAMSPFDSMDAPSTVALLARPVCWLLMVDIKRYTSLSRQLDTNSLSLKIGTWLRHNRDAIESAGGVVDKFLGDAIFAYWKNNAEAPALVSRALQQLMVLQQQRDPDFRIVLHHAATTLEGGAGGANNLSGPEIIYTFRLEKVCSGLGTDTIVSSAAAAVLPAPWTCESMGRHPLDGFPGTHEVFQLVT